MALPKYEIEYNLFIKAIYHLQSIARIIYRQHIFQEIRKMMLRPLKVHIQSCSPVDLSTHVNYKIYNVYILYYIYLNLIYIYVCRWNASR